MKQTLFLILALVTINCYGQDDKQLVNDAVLDYVEAFYLGDTTKILRSISPSVVKYGYYRKKDATAYDGEPMSFREMLDYATNVGKRKNPNVEKYVKKIEVLDYQDQTASAKLTAWWGTDYILLAKLNGKWMITHVLWQSPPKQ
jgi:Putative lumazine-binding